MSALDNGEWALFFWILVFIVYVFSTKTMEGTKRSLQDLISAFFVRQIQTVLLLMSIYMGSMVYMLSKFEIWELSQIKNTLFWIATVGFVSLFKLEKIKKDSSLFKYLVIDSFKLTAVLEFIIGVYTNTIPLAVSIILLPLFLFVGAMTVMVKPDVKYQKVKSFLDAIIIFFGFSVIVYTLYMLVIDFNKITEEHVIYDFMTPLLLNILFLPFLFFMMVYTTYVDTFIRIRFFIKTVKLRRFAMMCSIIVFNIRFKLLQRWASSLVYEKTDSYKGVLDSIRNIFKASRAEQEQIKVPYKEGWSPYVVMEFLKGIGFKTGYYHKSSDGWYASTPLIEFGEGLMPDNIAYYLEGTETAVKKLKLKLNVNESSRSGAANARLLEVSQVLIKAALNQDSPDFLSAAIVSGKPIDYSSSDRKITFQKEGWLNQSSGGYDAKLVISSI